MGTTLSDVLYIGALVERIEAEEFVLIRFFIKTLLETKVS